ncbi:hypothetical protein BU23DRAFT_595770 [Bimuria novae-zelandiae CBS 107.79]|uniref:F-box domain-containing protein n=1 Tax=Bimuria novae-zelandiae CBS 107.79 TaxID=1447943 RepID=A0A6A5VNY4_9PLEO|nr:hypothetical protein BU23DRAFT_595770 [Bimuria novae-zelandiae CBS 107.79]
MLQLRPGRLHLSPGDAFERHQSSAQVNEEDPTYHSHGAQFDSARINQSIAFRRASLATSSRGRAYDGYEIPRLTKTPWELERYKRNSLWKRTPNDARLPQHVFKTLPREVYDCILEQLELIHLGQHQPCPSCYLKDLCSLSLTSRAWARSTTLQMYGKIWVLGHDPGYRLPKLRVAGTSRLKLLRRTLRERNTLAKVVRELHMPDLQALYCSASIEREEIVDLVASLVMACPSLERLVGFQIPYTHSFDRLSHALSRRTKLKERMWVMMDAYVEEDEDEEGITQGFYHAACDPTERFLELNANQESLSTLILHQESAKPTIDLTYRAVVGTIRQMHALRHLSLSGLSASSFSNLALTALPPDLQSLRLENLSGINDKGLQRFSSSHVVASLKSLALIDLDINRLDVVAAFISPRLPLLEGFTMSQHRAPVQYTGPDTPVFRSETLKRIHWELRSQAGPPPTLLSSFASQNPQCFPFPNGGPVACLATKLLATSIEDCFLPALERIRAPYDPEGLLQTLCKPLDTALLRSAMSLVTTPPRPTSFDQKFSTSSDSDTGSTYSLKQFLSTAPDERTDSVMGSPFSASFDSLVKDTPLTSALAPARSRLAAQARILAARRNPQMVVRVVDPEGNVCLEKSMAGYLGNVQSKIMYDLKPDRNREVVDGDVVDAHEWLAGIDDVMGEWEVAGRYGGCRHAVGGWVGRKAVEMRELFC